MTNSRLPNFSLLRNKTLRWTAAPSSGQGRSECESGRSVAPGREACSQDAGVGKGSRRRRSAAWKLLSAPFLLFITLPLLVLLVRTSPADLWRNLNMAQVHQAIQISVLSSFCTVLVTLLLGTPVAYYLTHHNDRLYRVVDTLVELPTVLPPAVAGVALLMTFGRQGLVGHWLSPLGVTIPFTLAAVVLAQTFIAAPLYIKTAALGFSTIDCELKKAAALDGANRWQIFRHIMLPMTWTSLLSGAVLTWARALGEFGATIIFAGNFPGRTQTMPLAIYIGFEIDLDVALTLSVILIGFSFLTLILVKGFLQHRLAPGPEEVWE